MTARSELPDRVAVDSLFRAARRKPAAPDNDQPLRPFPRDYVPVEPPLPERRDMLPWLLLSFIAALGGMGLYMGWPS